MDLATNVCATTLLRTAHRDTAAIYQRFLLTEDIGERVHLAETLSKELEILSRLEECLTGPRLARAGPALLEGLLREHGQIKRLISEAQLARKEGPCAERDSRLVRIMAKVQPFVAEMEAQAFPLLEADPASDQELGAELARLRRELRRVPPIHQLEDAGKINPGRASAGPEPGP